MKSKLYTTSYKEEILRKIFNEGKRFTGEEHAYSSEMQLMDVYKSKESLIKSFLLTYTGKFASIGFVIELIKNNGYKNVLSLGAGECVIEYFFSCAFAGEVKIIAADFDAFFIKKAREYFPSIIPVEFDYCRDDVVALKEKLKVDFDLVVFFGSSYVMDDGEFVGLLKQLKKAGVKKVIDFYGGYITLKEMPSVLFYLLKRRLEKIEFINRIKNKIRSDKKTEGPGKFQGYRRSRKELRRIYRKAGFRVVDELALGCYKYVMIAE